MDGALGFNTFEKQDKVLVGLNGGMDAAVTVRILQEQGFAVQAALVHFAGMADDAVETAQNAAKALDVTLHVIEAADTAADELLKFQLLSSTAVLSLPAIMPAWSRTPMSAACAPQSTQSATRPPCWKFCHRKFWHG